jgi:hypothetical protein
VLLELQVRKMINECQAAIDHGRRTLPKGGKGAEGRILVWTDGATAGAADHAA